MKKVMCMGTFDLLHPGHLSYFKQAKKYGQYLIVVVARDSTVKKERKYEPFFNEKRRLGQIKKLPFVNQALPGNRGDKLKIVEKLKPDVICLGYDQKVSIAKLKKELKKRKLNVIVKRMKPYKPHLYKSSLLKKKLLKE